MIYSEADVGYFLTCYCHGIRVGHSLLHVHVYLILLLRFFFRPPQAGGPCPLSPPLQQGISAECPLSWAIWLVGWLLLGGAVGTWKWELILSN
jgi:hypothetical protein